MATKKTITLEVDSKDVSILISALSQRITLMTSPPWGSYGKTAARYEDSLIRSKALREALHACADETGMKLASPALIKVG